MVIGVTDTFAYQTYEGGCVQCHPEFLGGPAGLLHGEHHTLTGDCTSCHLIIGDDPATGYTPTSDTGTGCVGCHGRLEDEGNDSLQDGIGAGLRQHHFNAGISTCLDCHTDSFPGGIYTPVGEDVDPTFYPFLNPLALDPCADGLDNDGDLLYDGDDPDCAAGAQTRSGNVTGDVAEGDTITLSGNADEATETIGRGDYSFPDVANGGYTVTPSLAGYSFAPANTTVTIDGADVTGVDCVSVANEQDDDIDDDGVINEDDECESTPVDVIVDPLSGCSLEQLVPCNENWKNHGQYVSAFTQTLNSFIKQKLIAKDEKSALMKKAASSDCTAISNVTQEQIEAASNIDNSTAEYAQLLFGDLNVISEISVIAVDEGSNINTSKASIDGTTDTVYTRYAFEKGIPGGDFGNSANAITFVKTRTPEAIKYITGIDYTLNDDSPGMCKEVNEYIYEQTRLLLTAEQRIKYDSEGKQLLFIDDYNGALDNLPDPYSLITDHDTHLEVASLSVETYFYPTVQDDPNINDNEKNRYGVKYCKFIAAQNMLIWMLDMAFDNSTTLMKPAPTPGLSCEDMNKSVGSCYFDFFGFDFCEDYIGTNFTGGDTGNAKEKCLNVREGIYVDGVKCADREDINDTISGICAIVETDDGAYTWTMYEPSDASLCPIRFFTCE